MIRGKLPIFLMAVFLTVPLITSCGLYGRSSSKSNQVIEADGNQNPVAIAASDVTGGIAPLTVQFDGSGSYDPDGDQIAHFWDFGDGSAVSIGESPTHEYPTAGIFVATLTVYDTKKDSDNQKITITVLEPVANEPPVAVAASDITGGLAPLTVQFDGSGSYDPDNDSLTYLWNFGDGSADSSDVSPAHEYVTDGVYTASLTVSDPDGASDNQEITITVTAEPVVNEAPVAVAASDITGGPAPLTVQFDGSGSYDPDNDSLTYLWDFDDGTATSTAESPTHEYSDHGIYAARLTVQDPDGATDSQTVTITVTEPDSQSVAIDIKPGNWPNTINLTEEGVVTVAILTTPDFDAASVDTSIDENGNGKVFLSAALPKISGNSGKYSMFKDIDGDGDMDLVIQFYVELMDPDTFEIEGEMTYAILTGQTWDGKAIWGRDQIGIVRE